MKFSCVNEVINNVARRGKKKMFGVEGETFGRRRIEKRLIEK